jgi:DNA-binding protein Fis
MVKKSPGKKAAANAEDYVAEERARLEELDNLDNAAQKRIRNSIAQTLSTYLEALSGTETPPSKEQLEKPYFPEINPSLVAETETLIAAALLMGMDHARNKLTMADTEIPALPFEEAFAFMKSRVPFTKTEWNALEPKLRFRAFTVARLAQLDYIDTARQVLTKALETGKGTAETYKQWQAIQTLVQDDAMRLRPGYWENVFRTNTQTAYVAGKLMQFQNNPPPAWRLLIIDDSRTSDICRGLIREGKNDLVMASDHPFWKTFGFPPYHYQCRTGIQAVYQSQINHGVQVENPTIETLQGQFKPMKGFGGNPVENGNYWMMTPNMFERGLKYGVINEFNFMDNIVSDFESVWRGYRREVTEKGWIDIHEKARGSGEFDKNYAVAKKLAADGDHIKMLPVYHAENWKSPDYLINASLWELESPRGSPSSIDHAIRDGQNQAPNLIVQVPETANRPTVLRTIFNRFTRKDSPARIRKLILFFGDERSEWTADQIRRWIMAG